MSDAVTIALIVSAPTFITALGSLFVSLMNRKQALATATKLEVVHNDVNGKMAQLLEATGAKEHAAGLAAGLAEGRQAGISERADRVAESERVEDRVAAVAEHVAKIDDTMTKHDQWERDTKK